MMMLKKIPPKGALLAAVIKRERDRKAAVKKMEREIQRLYDAYFIRVARLIKSKKLSKTEVINLRDSTKIYSQLTKVLADAGYEDTIANYLDRFEDLKFLSRQEVGRAELRPDLPLSEPLPMQ